VENYAGNPNNYPANVSLLQDGDPPNASSFRPGHEGTLDRTAWLRARFTDRNVFGLLSPHEANYDGTYWNASTNKLLSLASSTFKPIIWRLRLPHNATLLELRAYFKGSPGHASLPATRCTLVLQSLQSGSDSLVTIDTVNDDAADVTAYELAHFLDNGDVLNGSTGYVIPQYHVSTPHIYQVVFQNEGGANSVAAGTELYSVEYRYSLANVPVGV
jgi:hypothetical protein